MKRKTEELKQATPQIIDTKSGSTILKKNSATQAFKSQNKMHMYLGT